MASNSSPSSEIEKLPCNASQPGAKVTLPNSNRSRRSLIQCAMLKVDERLPPRSARGSASMEPSQAVAFISSARAQGKGPADRRAAGGQQIPFNTSRRDIAPAPRAGSEARPIATYFSPKPTFAREPSPFARELNRPTEIRDGWAYSSSARRFTSGRSTVSSSIASRIAGRHC